MGDERLWHRSAHLGLSSLRLVVRIYHVRQCIFKPMVYKGNGTIVVINRRTTTDHKEDRGLTRLSFVLVGGICSLWLKTNRTLTILCFAMANIGVICSDSIWRESNEISSKLALFSSKLNSKFQHALHAFDEKKKKNDIEFCCSLFVKILLINLLIKLETVIDYSIKYQMPLKLRHGVERPIAFSLYSSFSMLLYMLRAWLIFPTTWTKYLLIECLRRSSTLTLT